MKGKKIITILIIINIILIGVICNFIKKDYLNNERIIIKTMTETGNESQIETLNQSHQNYKDYIQASKTELATAITNKGVATTADSTFETMTTNINNIVTNPPASLISYDNITSGLTSSNVQGAVDELDDKVDELDTEIDNLKFDSSIPTHVSNSFIAEKDGWIMVLAKCVTGGNCYIDDSNGFRVFFITELNGVLYLPIPIQKGITYNAFANGSGASISLIKMD